MCPYPPADRSWYLNLLDQQHVKIFEIRGVVHLLLEEVQVRLKSGVVVEGGLEGVAGAEQHARLLLQVELRPQP